MSRHRFDHAAALALYIELDAEKRTYAEVARRVGVSETTIRRVARLEFWEQRLREHGEKLVARALQTREQRALQDARIRTAAANRVEKRLDSDEVSDEWIRQVLQDADKRVRLNEGEATDHVAVAQVQAGFRESLAAASELVTTLVLERGLSGDELVRVFRVELPGRVQERLALIGGDDG